MGKLASTTKGTSLLSDMVWETMMSAEVPGVEAPTLDPIQAYITSLLSRLNTMQVVSTRWMDQLEKSLLGFESYVSIKLSDAASPPAFLEGVGYAIRYFS